MRESDRRPASDVSHEQDRPDHRRQRPAGAGARECVPGRRVARAGTGAARAEPRCRAGPAVASGAGRRSGWTGRGSTGSRRGRACGKSPVHALARGSDAAGPQRHGHGAPAQRCADVPRQRLQLRRRHAGDADGDHAAGADHPQRSDPRPDRGGHARGCTIGFARRRHPRRGFLRRAGPRLLDRSGDRQIAAARQGGLSRGA